MESSFEIKEVLKNKTEKKPEELLTKEQALLYQDYATKLDGKDFPDKASEKSYIEADELIRKLKSKDFNWLNIDWQKIDLKDVAELELFEDRLDMAAKQILEAQSGKNRSVSEFLKEHRNIILPLAISAAVVLTSDSVVRAEVLTKLKPVQTTEQILNKHLVEISGQSDGYKKCIQMALEKYKLEGIIKKLNVVSVNVDKVKELTVSATIEITDNNNKKYISSGSYLMGMGREPLLGYVLDEITDKINKKFNIKIDFNHYSSFQITLAERGAVVDAIKNYNESKALEVIKNHRASDR